MREIKFRAWNKSNKTMIHLTSDYNIQCEKLVELFDDCTYAIKMGMDVIIMQFTGLKDKNGKDIYENDVLSVIDVETHIPADYSKKPFLKAYDKPLICEVICEPAMWLVKGQINGHLITVFSRSNQMKEAGVEVIGNIYENPELIEK